MMLASTQEKHQSNTKKQTGKQAAEKPGFFFCFFQGQGKSWYHHSYSRSSSTVRSSLRYTSILHPKSPKYCMKKEEFPFLEENDVLQQKTQWHLWGLGFRV
jgi:hypothetical protein